VWLGRPIDHVSVTPGLARPGEEVGRCLAPVSRTDGIQPRDLVVSLAGYLAEGEAGWPPPYAEACGERREALATVIRVLDLDQDQYETAIDLTRRMLDTPEFRRLQSSIARALRAAPTITGDDVEAPAAALGYPRKRQGALTT
jgi:hypothetical protein